MGGELSPRAFRERIQGIDDRMRQPDPIALLRVRRNEHTSLSELREAIEDTRHASSRLVRDHGSRVSNWACSRATRQVLDLGVRSRLAPQQQS